MRKIISVFLLLISSFISLAQAENEIQVYASPTVGDKKTIFELHSNYTMQGIKRIDALTWDPHFLNESLEITHGFGENFEIGFYVFTTLFPNGQYKYSGSHIRPRITAPESWKWKVGASISAEFGFFRAGIDQPFEWEGEIRPIIDKTAGNWYISLNPNMDFVLTGDNKHLGFGPQFKAVYTIKGKAGIGAEYYTSLGTFRKINSFTEEEHLLGPMIDLYLSPNWEFNGGFLFGLTPNSNRQIVKIIIGRRVGK